MGIDGIKRVAFSNEAEYAKFVALLWLTGYGDLDKEERTEFHDLVTKYFPKGEA